MSYFKQFGGKPGAQHIEQYQQSANWRNGSFQNLEPTDMTVKPRDFPRLIAKQLSGRSSRVPKQALPVLPFDNHAFLSGDPHTRFVWYGHSALLMRMNGQTLLIDPMLGPDTTPIAPTPTRRFSENTLSLIDDFPGTDLVLITHDHYDHLDFASISRLKHKTKQYFVALGVKRHLVAWGIAPELVTEFDWWDTRNFKDIAITFTPTRHFSGRGLTDRFKSLWGGWVFKTERENIWFSGDGGYGAHFREIGRRLGPFDFAFMECGQYNDDWRLIHLFPEEGVQAAIDARARKAMPVHWGAFALSYQHTWTEPPAIFTAEAARIGFPVATPALGQVFSAGTELLEPWWEKY